MQSMFDYLWTPHDCNLQTLQGIQEHHYFESLEPYVLWYATTSNNVTTKNTFSFVDGKVQDHDASDHSVHQDEKHKSTDLGKFTQAHRVEQWVNLT